jgi:hypothetical protein
LEIIKYLYTPFPRPKKTKGNLLKVFLFGLLASLFIIVFEPYNIVNNDVWLYNIITIGLGVLFSSSIYFMEFILPALSIKLFKKWYLGKAILWYAWVIIFVSGIMFLAKSFLAGFNDFTFLEFINVIGRISVISLTVSFLSLGIISFLNRQRIALISSGETYKITAPNAKPIQLNLQELLYIASDDNYVDIHLHSNGKRDKIVFRSSLKNIEDQIVNPLSPMYRCHRRYLVNINYFKIKSSKVRNTSISLLNYEDEIPVSNKYTSDILRLLQTRP